jgi:hypothetical protein
MTAAWPSATGKTMSNLPLNHPAAEVRMADGVSDVYPT